MWFQSMITQFNHTDFGATGFNYVVGYRDFDHMGLEGVSLDEWKWKLKIMESEALKFLNRAD